MDTKTTPGKSLSEALNDELLDNIDEELELEFDDQRLDSVLGPVAPDAIRETAKDLKLDINYQARVRQTGLVAINDDEFAALRESVGLNIAVSVLGVLIVLWLALRCGESSWRSLPASLPAW